MWLAESAGQGLDQYLPPAVQVIGVVGLLTFAVVALTRGWLVPAPSHRSALAEKDKRIAALEAECQEQKATNREQTLFLRDQVTPLLTRNTDVLARLLEEQRFEERQRRET